MTMVTYGLGGGSGSNTFITAFDLTLDALPDVEVDLVGVTVDVDQDDIVVTLDTDIDLEVEN